MKFEHLNYLPFVLLFLVIFIYIYLKQEKTFFKSVQLYWFYNRTWMSRISSFLLLIGFSLLVLSLLDLRGPEERIKAQAPVERTIILIDTSASMLAEDIKPSRLEKAVLLAKHYARKATGQQLSVVVFSEIQKKLVPFTNDLDLIDSRLDSIKNLKNHNGSSALSIAIQESIQHLKEAGGETGNILVFTDGEETAADISLKVPPTVKLALVGIGTERGGRIPLDDGRGLRYGYKKHKGQDVVTKLEEKFFKQIESKVGHSKYWLSTTYNLPTDDVVEYFKSTNSGEVQKEQEMIIKPVMMEYIVIPSLICIGLGYILKFFKAFALVLLFLNFSPAYAQDAEELKLSSEAQEAMMRLKNGKISPEEKIKLSEDLLKNKSVDDAISVYEEARNEFDGDISVESQFNYATALLQKDKIKEAAKEFESLKQKLGNSENANKIKEMIKENMKKYFQKKEEEKKQKEKQSQDNKNNKGDKDQNQNSSDQKNQGQSGSNDDNQQNKPEDSKSDQKDDSKKNENDSDDQKGEDQKNSEEDSNKDNDNDKKKNPDKGPEEKGPKPKNISPKLKQLMSDDRQLQLKMIEQGTKDMNRRQNRENKDW